MDGLASLLVEARCSGLTVQVEGERLVVRGPRSATAVATQLLARKAEVLASLTSEEAAVQERMDTLRPLVPRSGPIPFLLVRPQQEVQPGCCPSCGEPLEPTDRYRCRFCVEAVRRVLAQVEAERRAAGGLS
jgi:hypothetical protein